MTVESIQDENETNGVYQDFNFQNFQNSVTGYKSNNRTRNKLNTRNTLNIAMKNKKVYAGQILQDLQLSTDLSDSNFDSIQFLTGA